MPDPSFWAGARKAFVALLVGVVAAGGVITAAAADDRITVSEWWTIGLAVAAAIVGPVGVYATRNAVKPTPAVKLYGVRNDDPEPAVAAPATPVVRAHVDGTVDLTWPGGASDRAVVSRRLLEAMVAQHNKLTAAAAAGKQVRP